MCSLQADLLPSQRAILVAVVFFDELVRKSRGFIRGSTT